MSDSRKKNTDRTCEHFPRSLPLRGNPKRPPRRVILASHLVFSGYAHWLSNDPRGSGSIETRKDELRDLGDVHQGRKHIQPHRDELRQFHRNAKGRLDHEIVWFQEQHRTVIGNAVGSAAQNRGYTLWACAVCSNHAHVVVRSHRDRSELIWDNLSISATDALRKAGLVAADHPVWSHRIYKVFLYTSDDVLGRIDYVEQNPEKEGLPRQSWSFVTTYPR